MKKDTIADEGYLAIGTAIYNKVETSKNKLSIVDVKKIINELNNKDNSVSPRDTNKMIRHIGKLAYEKNEQGGTKIKVGFHYNGLTAKGHYDDSMKYRCKLTVTSERKKTNPVTKVCCIMLNPSYSNDIFADISTLNVEKLLVRSIFENKVPKIALKNQSDNITTGSELVIVNQFPLYKTKGFKCADVSNIPKDIKDKNKKTVISAIRNSDVIILAWGTESLNVEYILGELLTSENTGKTIYASKHPSKGDYCWGMLAKVSNDELKHFIDTKAKSVLLTSQCGCEFHFGIKDQTDKE